MPMPVFKDRFMKRFQSILGLDSDEVFDIELHKNEVKEYLFLDDQIYNDGKILTREDMIRYESIKELVKKVLASNLMNDIEKLGGHIAGSFILDCLYDTDYSNDIDIYCPCVSYDRETHQSPDRLSYYFFNAGFNVKCNGDDNDSRTGVGIITVMDTSKKIQIINVPMAKLDGEKSCISRFINATFDMDICKSNFNGEKLQVRDMNKLIERYDYIICTAGLVLDIYPNILSKGYNILKEQRNITNQRKLKYTNRGFKIKDHPQMKEIIDNISSIIVPQTREAKLRNIDKGILNLDKYHIHEPPLYINDSH